MNVTVRDLALAYLAGVIDSDGHITIGESRGLYYTTKVGITGTRRQPHDLAVETFGIGRVRRYAASRPGCLSFYQWQVHGTNAAAVLCELTPHLRVKAEHAVIVLQYQELVATQARQLGKRSVARGEQVIPPEMAAARKVLYERIVPLNQDRRRKQTGTLPDLQVQDYPAGAC